MFKIGVLKNFTISTGKHMCWSLFLNKLAGLLFPLKPTENLEFSDDVRGNRRPATLLKKRLQHTCFPVNISKFYRTPFLQNASGRLRLTFGRMFQSPIFLISRKLIIRMILAGKLTICDKIFQSPFLVMGC